MSAATLTKEKILQDMEAVFQQAFADNKWRIALRAKELQAKILGFFGAKADSAAPAKPVDPKPPLPLPHLENRPRAERRRQMKEMMREASVAPASNPHYAPQPNTLKSATS